MVKPFERKKLLTTDRAFFRQMIIALETISQQLADQNKIEEIKKVSFKEGDCIVLLHQSTLSEEALQNLREGLKGFFKIRLGFDVPVLVFEEGMKFEVLSKE